MGLVHWWIGPARRGAWSESLHSTEARAVVSGFTHCASGNLGGSCHQGWQGNEQTWGLGIRGGGLNSCSAPGTVTLALRSLSELP